MSENTESPPTPNHRLICVLRLLTSVVLGTIPFVLALGHWRTRDTLWLYNPPKKFSFLTNYISDYAYRSPAWFLFIGSMYAFGFVLLILSIRFFLWNRRRMIVPWLLSLLLGYAGLKLVEVASFPVKAPEVRIEQIQKEMDKGSWERFKDSAYEAYRKARGRPVKKTKAATVVEMFESNSKHILGIAPAMIAICMAMVLSLLLAPKEWKSLNCRIGLVVSFGLVIVSWPYLGLFGGWVGLAQRLGFLGVYIWMWLVIAIFFKREAGREVAEVELRKSNE